MILGKTGEIVKELGKYVEQLESRDIGIIAFEVDEETCLKILELYGDRLEECDFEKVLKNMSEENQKQAKRTKFERKNKEMDKRIELREMILGYKNQTNVINICEKAEQDCPASEQEKVLRIMVREMERSNERDSEKGAMTR